MNGVHDLGGMHGLGPVEREANEPAFHEPWEARTFAIMNLAGAAGMFNVDEVRHAIERMGPVDYLNTPYYVHWLHGIEDMMASKGIVPSKAAGATVTPPAFGPALPKAMVGVALATGVSVRIDIPDTPRFKIGDEVTARNINPTGHTRLPRYIRGKTGTVQHLHGSFAFADTRAHGKGEKPQHIYNVRFTARELWGAQASDKDSLYIDLWDDYVDPA